MTNDRNYVIAYNWAQYAAWCRENGYNPRDTNLYYVKDWTSLMGIGYLNQVNITYLPHWNKRDDAQQIALSIAALMRANGTRKEHKMSEGGIFTWTFWKRTLERMIRAFAGSLLGVLTMDGFNLLSASWVGVLSAALTASLVSMILSIIGSNVGNDGDNPSFVK